MDAIIETIRDVVPLFKDGLEARLGGTVTILRVVPLILRTENIDQTFEFTGTHESGCMMGVTKWTEITSFQLKFIYRHTINGTSVVTSMTLGTYVTREDKEERNLFCYSKIEYADQLTYEGPSEYELEKKEHKEFLASLVPKWEVDEDKKGIKQLD